MNKITNYILITIFSLCGIIAFGCKPEPVQNAEIIQIEKAKELIAAKTVQAEKYNESSEENRKAMILERVPGVSFDNIERLGRTDENVTLKNK
ncbi:hypothetical protein DDZ13_09695 [Coraliomargarita sinensis]|uniref:Uncharacterized protein n=1 Tax=Coraliomargarita sinensis TaxID=2174842 RepID=A0A317ZI59_9BACT|nr:hypothetical protein [Coraliomargarita sinensis]PXA03903.1 hypothetical protein DDZ13_09695 [Coraliomargarita sinensis]